MCAERRACRSSWSTDHDTDDSANAPMCVTLDDARSVAQAGASEGSGEHFGRNARTHAVRQSARHRVQKQITHRTRKRPSERVGAAGAERGEHRAPDRQTVTARNAQRGRSRNSHRSDDSAHVSRIRVERVTCIDARADVVSAHRTGTRTSSPTLRKAPPTSMRSRAQLVSAQTPKSAPRGRRNGRAQRPERHVRVTRNSARAKSRSHPTRRVRSGDRRSAKRGRHRCAVKRNSCPRKSRRRAPERDRSTTSTWSAEGARRRRHSDTPRSAEEVGAVRSCASRTPSRTVHKAVRKSRRRVVAQ